MVVYLFLFTLYLELDKAILVLAMLTIYWSVVSFSRGRLEMKILI